METHPNMIMQSSTTCHAVLSKHIYSTNIVATWYIGDCAKCLLNDHSMSANILTLKRNSEEIHLSFKNYKESGHGVD
jgi:hypothetical protein